MWVLNNAERESPKECGQAFLRTRFTLTLKYTFQVYHTLSKGRHTVATNTPAALLQACDSAIAPASSTSNAPIIARMSARTTARNVGPDSMVVAGDCHPKTLLIASRITRG